MKLAEAELEKAGGVGRFERGFGLKVEQVRLLLERIRATARTKVSKAEAAFHAKSIETDFGGGTANRGTRRGSTLYLVAPATDWCCTSCRIHGTLAPESPGEAVKEGQKLLRICGLKGMEVVFSSSRNVHPAAAYRTEGIGAVDAFPISRSLPR